jgi:hypothetical protein
VFWHNKRIQSRSLPSSVLRRASIGLFGFALEVDPADIFSLINENKQCKDCLEPMFLTYFLGFVGAHPHLNFTNNNKQIKLLVFIHQGSGRINLHPVQQLQYAASGINNLLVIVRVE